MSHSKQDRAKPVIGKTWQGKKIHTDAIEQLDDGYLKEKRVIDDSMIEVTSMGSIINYGVSSDPEYMKILRNSVTEKSCTITSKTKQLGYLKVFHKH